ncbi:MAG: hypothetical protein PHO62_03675 [Sulfurimonas sp.]|uniref:hypothetical protein n=1 Tax=Sulfurimonas sp. TaxID=2022749 RepID=UPI00261296DB|nr:hypothetical protein [Sulfurimonas sp.]MDD5372512.1 hypothetical protein [Sulfurimonas sp.]
MLLLLFAMSFSVLHDYTFAVLDNHCSSACTSKASFEASNETTDTLCKIHTEYHTPYLFLEKSAYIPIIQKRDDFFTYNEMFLSLDYFSFFKPPIA